MDAISWLRSQEFFGGYQFEKLEIAGADRGAQIVRELVEREEFVKVIVDQVMSRQESFQYIVANADHYKTERLSLALLEARVSLANWNGHWRFACIVEDLVLDCLRDLGRFERLPKRSPGEHAKRLKEIASLASELACRLDAEESLSQSISDGMYGGASVRETLQLIADAAKEEAEHPPLMRPKAKSAARTFVAKELSRHFHSRFGGYRHEAAATLINAIFNEEDAIDAVYMQSLAKADSRPLE
jgi:hypothetical protein